MSTHITLTPKELVQHLGRRVKIDSVGHDKHDRVGTLQYVRDKIEGNPLTPTAGVCFEGESFTRIVPIQSVRLLLRPLASLTDHEAKQCFRSGYPYWDQREEVSIVRSETQIEIISGPIKLMITTLGIVSSERWIDRNPSPARVNVLDILHYLDSLLIDTHGYIEQGLAIATTE